MRNIKYIVKIFLLMLITLMLFIPFISNSSDSNKISLNFNKTDIETVIKVVSKYTKTVYLVSPDIRGKVTFISNEPMRKDEVKNIIPLILEMHGLKIVEEGKIAKIVPKISECQKKLNDIKTLIEG